MKQNFTFVLLVLLIAMLSSCIRSEAETSIDLDADTPTSVFDLFSEVKVVSLETTPDNLISRIGQVEYFEGRYYILDWQSQQIFVFTEQGAFVFKISAKGNGPGEYHHLSHFTIDDKRRQLVLLDAPMQRVHAFDFTGQHVETMDVSSEVLMGYNEVYVLNDSILLITSITNEYLTFFNRKEQKIVARDYMMKEFLFAFTPLGRVYQLNGKTYVIPPVDQQIMDVSQMDPDSSFTWCFGANNNSRQQIDRLLEELESRKYERIPFLRFFHDGVGPGKFLNHHIIKASETRRFKIVLVEHDNDFKHVIVDKKTNQPHVFSKFNEGISLIFSEIKQDRVIAYHAPMKDYFLKQDLPELAYRTYDSFQREILDDAGKAIFDRHDPMNQNPFLVLYFFRE